MLSVPKIIIFICTIVLCTTNALAANFNHSFEFLPESSDYQSVQECSLDLCNMVNSLLHDDQSISESDIDWNNVYKIYVDDEDIFSLDTFSKSHILNMMKYIWSYSTTINGHQIRATISRASTPNHALVDQNILSEEEYMEVVNKAGAWCVPEVEIDTNQTPENIISSLDAAGIGNEDEVILIGGSPKMRTLFAVTFVDGVADKLIPLMYTETINQDMNVVSESQSTLSELTAGTAYNFEEVAQALSNITLSGNSTGGIGGYTQSENYIAPAFITIIELAILLCCAYKIKKEYMIEI